MQTPPDDLVRARSLLKDCSIISNDCWGGQLYKTAGLPYRTPFVGLYLMAPCFLSLATNFWYYLSSRLEFVGRSSYFEVNERRELSEIPHPIGILRGEVEIQFLHYATEEEAEQKWYRRCRLFNQQLLAFKLSASKDRCTSEMVRAFSALPHSRKLVLAAEPYDDCHCVVQVPDYENDGSRMALRSLEHFDLYSWLENGDVVPNSRRECGVAATSS